MSTITGIIVLPASGHVVPDSGFSVSSISQTETSRGVAFVAKLRYEGRYVGTYENAGVGGMDEVDLPPFLRDRFNEASEAFLSTVDADDPEAMPALAYALMDEHDMSRAYTRWSKQSIVFMLDSGERRVGKIPVANSWLREPMLADLAAQHPQAVVWSDGAFVPAADLV